MKHLRRPNTKEAMGCWLAVCSNDLRAIAEFGSTDEADCPDCLVGRPPETRLEYVTRLFGGEVIPSIGEMFTHLMAGGVTPRLVSVLRSHAYAGGYVCCVNQDPFDPDPELWGALANAVVGLAKG